MTHILVLFCSLLFAFIYPQLKGFNVCLFNEKALPREGRAVQKEKLHWDQFQPVQQIPVSTEGHCKPSHSCKGLPLLNLLYCLKNRPVFFFFFSIKSQWSLLNIVSAQEKTETIRANPNPQMFIVSFALLPKYWMLQLHSWHNPSADTGQLSSVIVWFSFYLGSHFYPCPPIFSAGPDPFWGAQPGPWITCSHRVKMNLLETQKIQQFIYL